MVKTTQDLQLTVRAVENVVHLKLARNPLRIKVLLNVHLGAA